ncbi:hypothetical protein KR222_003194 [Zaprionus bogoriensis]|nr:hypothetical protein KR222_003194 [Zaprionus bogoriensis]
MEYMECDAATRASILEHFRRRELFVPNAQNLPTEELHQIYKGFIAPQPRRQRRERERQRLSRTESPPALSVEPAWEAATELQSGCAASPPPSAVMQLLICVAGEKRRASLPGGSSPPKRCRSEQLPHQVHAAAPAQQQPQT